MSPEAQRIAIAEACGFRKLRPEPDDNRWVTPDGANYTHTLALPDYLNDLNAMHEAEKVLNPPPMDRITDASTHSKEWLDYSNQLAWVCPIGTWIRATAAQRAEAFLKTLQLWKP